RVVTVVHVHVGAADPAVADGHDDLVVAGGRVGHLFHRQLTGSGDQRRLHDATPGRSAWISATACRGSGWPNTSDPGTTPSAPAAASPGTVCGRIPPSTTTSRAGSPDRAATRLL